MSLASTEDQPIVPESGPLFIGIILNYLFTGILIHQLYDYSKNYPNDRPSIKYLVYGVFVLDLLQTGFTTQFAWSYCVLNDFLKFEWTVSIAPMMAGLIAMIVQFFYAWRIWCLGGRWLKVCSVAIALIAFTECLCAFIGSIKYDVIGVILPTPSTISFFGIWLAGSFSCDVLIAVCMTIIFLQVKTSTDFESTNTVLNILIRHVVETAAITAVSAGIEFVLFLKSRNSNLGYDTPALLLGKLYSNCLLAMLNNRKHLVSSISPQSSGNMIRSFRLRNLRRKDESLGSTVVDLTSIKVERELHVQCADPESLRRGNSLESARDLNNKNYIED